MSSSPSTSSQPSGEGAGAKSAERLQLALSCAGMGIFDWDASGGEMTWDEQMHALFGMKETDAAGAVTYRQFLSFIHREDVERTTAELRRAIETRSVYDGEFRVVWPSDGSVHTLRVRFQVSASAGSIHVAGVCWDVSKRRDAERQLATKSVLLNALMEALPDHIYFKDRESRFIAVNRAKAASNRLDPAEMVGKMDFDFFSEEHARAAFEDEQRIIATGKSIVGVEEKETWPDGSVTWVSTTKLPLRDSAGQIIGTFGLSRDITEHKRLEDEVREQKKALEQDLEMARELQTALLPQVYPCFPSESRRETSAIRFHHVYRPSTAVSGDFYAAHYIDDHTAGLFICDVMGHGVRAALVAAIVRTLVAGLGRTWREPADFLTQLNAALCGALGETKLPIFASGFYLVADIEEGRLHYANAGHPCALHISGRNGEGEPKVSPLNGGKPGPALGLFSGAQYERHTRSLALHDVILLFTDGLFEVENRQGDLYDYQRLVAAVGQSGGLPPRELCNAVIHEAERFCERPEFGDDVCVVAMEIARLGAGAR